MAATFLNQKNVDPVLHTAMGRLGGPTKYKGVEGGSPCPLLLHI